MEYIKLKVDKLGTNGDFFKKGSVLQLITEASKTGDPQEFIPIDAYDETNFSYLNGREVYSMKLNKDEYRVVTKQEPRIITSSIPGLFMDDEEKKDDYITLALKDAFEDKDFMVDINGTIQKKSAFMNSLTENDDEITTDFSDKVDGQDEPGITDDYKEDSEEKPAEKPVLGPLAKLNKKYRYLKRIRSKIKTSERYENNLTESDDEGSTDYDPAIDGSGTIDKNTYTEDTKVKPAVKPLLGPLAILKQRIATLKKLSAMQNGQKIKVVEILSALDRERRNYLKKTLLDKTFTNYRSVQRYLTTKDLVRVIILDADDNEIGEGVIGKGTEHRKNQEANNLWDYKNDGEPLKDFRNREGKKLLGPLAILKQRIATLKKLSAMQDGQKIKVVEILSALDRERRSYLKKTLLGKTFTNYHSVERYLTGKDLVRVIILDADDNEIGEGVIGTGTEGRKRQEANNLWDYKNDGEPLKNFQYDENEEYY